MNPAVKLFLFLLVLPFLIGFFLVFILPLVIILLIFSLFIPSVRVFHIFQNRRERNCAEPFRSESGTDETVCDVECTVVESRPETEKNQSSDRPPELNP
ncbi:MAG: hypothetical protein J5858_12720 [Lentisphaeria bacterium]|nr:hypothetical protein [Lentisphaeria bacterium]